MTVASELTVELEGKEVGLSALLTKVDQQTQKAADSALKLQAQYARLAQAQGNSAGASQILSNALRNNGGASEQAIVGVSTQLTKLQTGFQGGASYAQQFGGALKSQLLGIAGPAAVATTAIGALKAEIDLAQAGAQLNATRASFDSLAVSINTTGDVMLGKLRQAAQGTVSDAKLIESANSGILLTQGKLATDLPKLLEIARSSARASGDDVGFVFDSLVKGIARGSPQIIDNAKITLDAAGAFQTYAASIGKSSDQLTREEQQQATLNAVLAAGDDIIAKTGGTSDKAALAFQRLATAGENVKNGFSQGLANTFAPVADGLANILTGLDGTREGTASFVSGIASALQSLQGFGVVSEQQAASNQQVADSFTRGAQALGEYLGILSPATAATIQHATATDEDRIALGQAQAAAQQKAEADQNAAAQSQIASVNAQTLALANTQLAQQAQLAAGAMIASGNGGAAAAARLAGSSSLVDQLTAAYLRLAAAQGQATQAKLSNQTARQLIGAGSDEAELRAGKSAALRDDRRARIQQTQAAQRAEEAYQQALGNNGPAIARANRELAQLTKGTAAYYTKLTEITNLENNGKKSRGGGGVKLTEQQRLNNALLSDQEKFNDKFEDTDLKHAENRLKIQQDYAAKAHAAELKFSDDQFESRASFYDRLSSIESGKIQQASSAAYEQAANEAGKIAAEKGADVADRYMAEQEKTILARAQRLAEIEQLQKDKKAPEAANKQNIDALYRQVEDRRLQRIVETNDSIAAEHDRALGEEDRKYEESIGTVAIAAERAADHRIAASQRAGQAVDDERLKLEQLGQAYDQTSGRRPAAAGGGTAPAPTTSPAPAAGDPLIAAIDGARAAIVAALAAVERAARDTTGAVQGLKRTGGVAG